MRSEDEDKCLLVEHIIFVCFPDTKLHRSMKYYEGRNAKPKKAKLTI